MLLLNGEKQLESSGQVKLFSSSTKILPWLGSPSKTSLAKKRMHAKSIRPLGPVKKAKIALMFCQAHLTPPAAANKINCHFFPPLTFTENKGSSRRGWNLFSPVSFYKKGDQLIQSVFSV
jgi:hypothetical protein